MDMEKVIEIENVVDQVQELNSNQNVEDLPPVVPVVDEKSELNIDEIPAVVEKTADQPEESNLTNEIEVAKVVQIEKATEELVGNNQDTTDIGVGQNQNILVNETNSESEKMEIDEIESAKYSSSAKRRMRNKKNRNRKKQAVAIPKTSQFNNEVSEIDELKANGKSVQIDSNQDQEKDLSSDSEEDDEDEEKVTDEPDQYDLSLYYWKHNIDFDKNLISALSSTNKSDYSSYLKGVKWAPDGSCLMTNCEDNTIRIYNLPTDLSQGQEWETKNPSEEILTPVLNMKEGGQIYDYSWFPKMTSFDPLTCCFITTSAKAPVHMWDAFTGLLRCSYRVFNHLDEPIAAYCVAFDKSGHNIYCGFDKFIKVFDISRPGRECTTQLLTKAPQKNLCQPGIVSAITFNPFHNYLYAVGTFRKTVGLYSNDGSVLGILEGHLGGITHMTFSNDGSKLFTGARKDSQIICWDVRMLKNEYKTFERICDTHQRIYFDITSNDQYLISGGTDGYLKIWDLKSENENQEPFKLQASTDCINGVSLNKFVPLLATSSGQRHFSEINDNSDSEEMFKESDAKRNEDNSLKLWKLL